MVALAPPNIVFNATPDTNVVRILVVEVRKGNTGDTIDVGTQLPNPRVAVFVGSTNNVRTLATIAGPIITLPAGINNDSGYVIALGL